MIINVSDVGIVLNNGLVDRAWITYDGPRRWMDIRLGSKMKITQQNQSSLSNLISHRFSMNTCS